MLRIKNIKYDLFSFGPPNGQPTLFIDFDNDNTVFEITEKSDLYVELKSKLKELKLEQQWISAINGTLEIFLCFNGGFIEMDEHFKQWDQFHIALSRESVETQKALKIKPDKLRPPFCIWIGEPKTFTGQKNYYQYFNCVIALIYDLKYTQLALQEIINHQFSSVCVTSENYKKIIKDLRSKYHITHKLVLIDTDFHSEVYDYCLDNKIKYNCCINKNLINVD